MCEEIDYEKLRNDLIDYFGTAMSYNPMVVIEIGNVVNATNYRLEQIAIKNGFNLNDYTKKKSR